MNGEGEFEKLSDTDKDGPVDNNDVKVDVVGGGGDSDDKGEFAGMKKEELLVYSTQPFWVRTRLVLLILFWICWLGMLIGAIIIVALAPRCPPETSWYKSSISYQLHPRSFKDSDGDGNGDLPGVLEKLEHFTYINVGSLFISPVFEAEWESTTDTPQQIGYHILDHKAIDPIYGTDDDFSALYAATKALDIQLILDFIPNHTPITHSWFNASKSDSEGDYGDYYIWADSPNDWLNNEGDSAWTYDDTRGQYYFHQFGSDLADLNLRNDAVKEELESILHHWLHKGVMGFIIRDASYLMEPEVTTTDDSTDDSTDVVVTTASVTGVTDAGALSTVAATTEESPSGEGELRNNPENHDILADWYNVIQEYNNLENTTYVIVEVEGEDTAELVEYYGEPAQRAATAIYHPAFTDLTEDWVVTDLDLDYNFTEHLKSNNRWAYWASGTSDVERIATRVGMDNINLLNMMVILSPGTPLTYFGEEIGIWNTVAADYEAVSPMQWTDAADNAGFSTNTTTWMYLTDSYQDHNVATETGVDMSAIEFYKSLTALRVQEPAFYQGESELAGIIDDTVMAFVRYYEDWPAFLVAINPGGDAVNADFTDTMKHVKSYGKVELSTYDPSRIGRKLHLAEVHLDAGEGVVLRLSN